MSKQARQKFWQACLFLVCIGFTWMYANNLGASEFSGGRITGPVLTMFHSGTLLFVTALIVVFFYPRISAAIGLAASLLMYSALFLFFSTRTVPLDFRW